MPATYCSLHYHAVFSTKDRYPTITKDWRENLHAYMGGIEDHAHLLLGLRATHAIANMMRDVKSGSSDWAHATVGKKSFGWQPGYFGVTVSPSHIEKVTRYILNQEEHHRHQSFEAEYLEMLKLAGIDYDERYVW